MPQNRSTRQTRPQRRSPSPTAAVGRPGRRRALYAVLALGLLALAGASAWWLFRAPSTQPGPIILISVDTLRADHLPAYGYAGVKTPAIDGLAADGVVFERAYAHSPQTLPSHAAILTGRLPFENGVRDNVGFSLKADGPPTLAELLHRRQFATGGVVSAFVLRKETGIGRGFDFFDAELPPSAPDTPMGQVQRDGMESLAVAKRWMSSLDTSRFFLFFHIYEPHTPYTPPARYSQYAPYDGEVAYSDEIVGQLFRFLKDRGLYDSALIVFLSDHGEGLGDHGEQEHGLFLYDETIRVPLIVKLPHQADAGSKVEQPVEHLDLVPTILDLVGAPAPAGLRGRSLRRVLASPGAKLPDPGFYAEAFYSRYHFGWSELVSLTDARYRFIKAPRPELYDLKADPRELRNIAADRAQTAGAMRAGLDTMLRGLSAPAPERVAREDLERLQALGYVGTQMADPNVPGDSLPDPKDKAALLEIYRRALQLGVERRYGESIDLLRQVVADSPRMKDGWLALGVELTRAGRQEEALAVFKQLVELDPTDANSFVSAGGSLLALKRFDEAIANGEMALSKAQPNDARARTSACELIVRAAVGKKDYAAARRAGQQAEEAEPRFPLVPFAEGLVLHDQKKFGEALAQFQQAAKRLQGSSFTIPDLFYYLGDTLGNLGEGAAAEASFKEEIRQSPGNIRARSSLAALYRAEGRNAEAEQTIAALLQSVPTAEAYNDVAKLWMVFGEAGRAAAVRAEAERRFARTKAVTGVTRETRDETRDRDTLRR